MQLVLLLCQLTIALTVSYVVNSQPHDLWPEVRLPQGLVRGRSFRTPSGRDYIAFLGIPYATPPLGRHRFKVSSIRDHECLNRSHNVLVTLIVCCYTHTQPPVPSSGWTQVLTASSYRDPCPQFDSRATELGSEDCLYVNVYTPSIQVLHVFHATI